MKLDNILQNNFRKTKINNILQNNFRKIKLDIIFQKNFHKTKAGNIWRSSFHKVKLGIILQDIIRVKHGCILWYNVYRISLTTFRKRLYKIKLKTIRQPSKI